MEAKLHGGATKPVYSIVYEDISKSLVTKVAIRTKRGCRPSGLDADKWLGTIGSNQHGSSPLILR